MTKNGSRNNNESPSSSDKNPKRTPPIQQPSADQNAPAPDSQNIDELLAQAQAAMSPDSSEKTPSKADSSLPTGPAAAPQSPKTAKEVPDPADVEKILDVAEVSLSSLDQQLGRSDSTSASADSHTPAQIPDTDSLPGPAHAEQVGQTLADLDKQLSDLADQMNDKTNSPPPAEQQQPHVPQAAAKLEDLIDKLPDLPQNADTAVEDSPPPADAPADLPQQSETAQPDSEPPVEDSAPAPSPSIPADSPSAEEDPVVLEELNQTGQPPAAQADSKTDTPAPAPPQEPPADPFAHFPLPQRIMVQSLHAANAPFEFVKPPIRDVLGTVAIITIIISIIGAAMILLLK